MGRIIKEVEQEFGEPFWDVVRGFAADGHSIHSTAELLGYASDTPFRRLIKRHSVEIEFASAQESVFQVEARKDRKGKCTPAQRVGASIASAANPGYKRVQLFGITDTLAGHAARIGLSLSTVYKRYARRPDDLAYVFSKAKQYAAMPAGKGWQSSEFRAAHG